MLIVMTLTFDFHSQINLETQYICTEKYQLN